LADPGGEVKNLRRRSTDRRLPADEEIDVYALTHPGLVRTENQDHFFVGQLRDHIEVRLTSLPEPSALTPVDHRLAFLAMVADGVGGGPAGELASRSALSRITRYVSECIHAYYVAGAARDESFVGELYAAALRVHTDLLDLGETTPGGGGLSTTLTVFIAVWPWVYVVQVGDSRYYVLNGDELTQVTRDQTIGQELMDSGLLKESDPARLRWSGVLSSAIGGSESTPVVTRIPGEWGSVHLLCSDGLTRHVSDERIRERLMGMTSARQACEDLMADALDAGGEDNITIIVGRANPKGDG
jgi:protein phosphatase